MWVNQEVAAQRFAVMTMSREQLIWDALAHYLPGYQSVHQNLPWKMWCNIWGIGYDDMIKRFASKDLMLRNGMTDSRWYEGAIRDDINQPNRIKMVIVWGTGLNSITQMKKQKKGLEEVEMIGEHRPESHYDIIAARA